jgi:hypothetical protein
VFWRALEWKMLVNSMTICKISWPFGVFYCHWVVMWWFGIYFSRFGTLSQENLATPVNTL